MKTRLPPISHTMRFGILPEDRAPTHPRIAVSKDMNLVEDEAIQAFRTGLPFFHYSVSVYGGSIYVQSNVVAKLDVDGSFHVSVPRPDARFVIDLLNRLPNVEISSEGGRLYLNGKAWNGHMTKIPAY